MATDKIVKPKQVYNRFGVQLELDVRHVPELGETLKQTILRSVAKPQKYLIQELPAFLHLTHRQYVSLLDSLEQMYESEERMFITPLNVMEVIVDHDADAVDPRSLGLEDPLYDFSDVEVTHGDVLQELN